MQLHDALVLEALLNSESGTELYAFDPPHQDWDEIALQDSLHMHSIKEKSCSIDFTPILLRILQDLTSLSSSTPWQKQCSVAAVV
ncbi:hypothetical protein BHE74_00049936 [Ensete ventricosum]|uniref:Uncharacterized protein n=1 Tax=Ensete ventricosum TaxID=4639 RepID=A0A426ZC32_ENSVE|nr:hypothetical protein B296_00041619 [Ensete ventricosum]RWW44313.1 hypothetical protein BHE74_00049936 [Ensete ventricosum]